MKSLSQFLISEELPVDDIEGRTKTGRVIKKLKKKGKKISDADRARLDDARLKEIERDAVGKQGEQIRKSVVKSQGQDDLLDKINKNRKRPVKSSDKFFGKPTGVDVKTGKAKYVPPKEIEGRSQYIDPKTNKASEKGIKSYINKARQMRTGSNVPVDSKTTDSIAKFSKSEYETKINQKYGGRRAKRARSNAPSLDAVQSKINKAEYAKILKKKNTSGFSKFSKKASEIKRTFTPQNTNPDLLRRMNMGAAGEDSNVSGSQKLSKTNVKALTKSQKAAIKGDAFSRATSRVTVNTSNPSYLPKSTNTLPTTKGKVGISWKKFSNKVNNKVKVTNPKLAKVNKFTKNLSPAINKFTAGLNWANTYNTARDRGRSRLGAGLKATATTAAYSVGATKGATLAAPIPVPGARIAGGIVGGSALSTATSAGIDKFFPAPGKKKTAVVDKKDKKNTTVIPNNKKTNKGSIINKGGIAI